jgi:hypothetical protein
VSSKPATNPELQDAVKLIPDDGLLETTYGDIKDWDTLITSMAELFQVASSFNHPIGGRKSSVTDMRFMFCSIVF